MSPAASAADDALRVSVVVATRNRARRLQALFEALARQTAAAGSFEVVVVDDGSSDGTKSIVEEARARHGFELRYEEGAARGPAAARNRGWRRASAGLIAFTDDDCEPDPRWLEAGVAAAEAAGRAAIVQGRTKPIPRESKLLGVRARTKSINALGPWFQTCNIFYPRPLLEELDGFDERFTRPFGEDVDLAWRALEAGAEARFAPDALVHHAVEQLGASAFVRTAWRDPDEALVFSRHSALRERVRRLGFFKSEQHALLAVAVGAGLIARGHWLGRALALPYAAHLGLRLRGARGRPADALLLVAYDVVEIAAAIRGASRHRVPLI